MRRGIKYEPISNCGLDRLPDDYHCMGYPVRYFPECQVVAHAMSLPVKNIIVGPAFFLLTGGEQWAVLLHEAGHLVKNHFWKRLLWLPFCWTETAEKMTHRQELEADDFAIHQGYGPDLLRFFRRVMHLPEDDFHPNIAFRYLYVEGRIMRRGNAKAA